VGVMKLLREAWSLTLCLWKLKTGLEWFLFWEIFSGSDLSTKVAASVV
jgi:hypothetical protein